MKRPPIVIVTGRSGSGKSTALAAFEDSGFYCVDNMPIALLPVFLEQSPGRADAFTGLAFGMDLRDKDFIHRVDPVLDKLKDGPFAFRILFLEADERTLLKRYSQTRRKHPLARNKSLHEAISAENPILDPLRSKADQIIDTSDLTVHDLKAIIRTMAADGQAKMSVQVISFGFKHGLPAVADLVMDVRFLKNPYFVDSLRPLSGKSEKIRSFVLNNDQTCLFLHKYFELLDILIPQYENEGKSYLTIAIGCTGGRHRSVVIAEQLREHIASSGHNVSLTHRDIDKVLS
ncbi:nucleotide-binding protein [Desulfosarcina widdelii]|uniref:Nucleotide-binding protein n=1 Tax=Desulfosarcina widdelii TaxID=947919 RepID=A0A5K7YVT1_9BACT|nr:RNase adapter RapZ [Desulfosarcina widdelii]BBO73852.1 nucleotide-binding protein [Desulfosarcina widdelii]